MEVRENFNLKAFNTFGIDCYSKYFSTFESVDELKSLLEKFPNEKLLILGGGSNILFTERNFDGLVLYNQIKGFDIIDESDGFVSVKSGGGESWHQFVMKCLEQNYGGVENLSFIPGSVGASPMQNIGAYGVEIKDIFEKLEAFHIKTKEIHTFNKDKCEFAYRESVFKRKLKGQYIILNVTYRLTKKHHSLKTDYGAIKDELKKQNINSPTIQDISRVVISIRESKLPNPKEIGNAGSFFKNPIVSTDILVELQKHYAHVPNYPVSNDKVKLAAGWLIEKAGWKGKVFGNYGVHKKQALVLVNYGGAKGNDIYSLSEQIIQDIQEKFGVTLEREVNIL